MGLSELTGIGLQPRPTDCLVPLTPYQLRWWNHHISRSKPLSAWRVPAGLTRVIGRLDPGLLRLCVEAVVKRHESLRTRIVVGERGPFQQVDAECGDDHFEEVDLTGIHAADVEGEASRLARVFIDEQVNLSVGPLFAAKLMRVSQREHIFLLGLDHIVSDAISYGILRRDIWDLYNKSVKGRDFCLPPLSVQFADYAVWQQLVNDMWIKRHALYWRRRLTGASVAEFPIDEGAIASELPTRASLNIPLGKGLSAKLRDVARREEVLVPLVILSIYFLAVSHWCQRRELLLGMMSHGRHNRPELENMIGILAHPLYLRIETSEGDSFVDLFKRIGSEFQAARRHEDFGRVPSLFPERRPATDFNWISSSWSGWSIHRPVEDTNQVREQPFSIQTGNNKVHKAFRMAAVAFDSAAGIVLRIEHRPDLFGSSTMKWFSYALRYFAEEIANRPLTRIASVVLQR